MRKILTIFALMVISLTIALGQTSNKKIEDEIQKLEDEFDQALSKRDAATLDRLTTDDFMVTNTIPARIITKEAFKERIKNMAARAFTIESRKIDDLKVRVYGDTAIATGHVKEIRKTTDGKTTDFEIRFTDVWVKRNGKWLMASSHASPANGVHKRE